jgi:predicted DNA-binding protein (UPF0251 family)
MSPRLKKTRKVFGPPPVKGFKPYGGEAPTENAIGPVFLHFEEYEALRLCDYDMFNHLDASAEMGVSRPTFTRIYATARQKIAQAFAEGRQIAFEGGKVYFDSDWYHCSGCGSSFNNPDKELTPVKCPLCNSNQIEGYEPDNGNGDTDPGYYVDKCVCPSCGFEKEHSQGTPCRQESCPDCNVHMKRKGTPIYGRKRGGKR